MPKNLLLCFPQLYITFPFVSGTVPKGPAALELQQKSCFIEAPQYRSMSQSMGKSDL